MVNAALVTGHAERDNLLLSFSATVHTHPHTHRHARGRTHSFGLYAGLTTEARLVLISGQDQSGGIRERGEGVWGTGVGGYVVAVCVC